MSNQQSKHQHPGYHIISEIAEKSTSCRDWEGFADVKEVIQAIEEHPILAHILKEHSKEIQQVTMDILTNILFEYLDVSNELPDGIGIYYITETILHMLTCNMWVKSGGEWTIHTSDNLKYRVKYKEEVKK